MIIQNMCYIIFQDDVSVMEISDAGVIVAQVKITQELRDTGKAMLMDGKRQDRSNKVRERGGY